MHCCLLSSPPTTLAHSVRWSKWSQSRVLHRSYTGVKAVIIKRLSGEWYARWHPPHLPGWLVRVFSPSFCHISAAEADVSRCARLRSLPPPPPHRGRKMFQTHCRPQQYSVCFFVVMRLNLTPLRSQICPWERKGEEFSTSHHQTTTIKLMFSLLYLGLKVT